MHCMVFSVYVRDYFCACCEQRGSHVAELAEKLGYLPLALSMAAAYMQVNHAIILSKHALYGVFSLCA